MFFFFAAVKHIGCFKDTGRRAIPQMDGRDFLVRDFYRRRQDAIKKCASTAMRRGYRAFAVQHQGWCATGPRAHVTYRKYGRSNRCRNGKGGPWANDVYFVSGKLLQFGMAYLTCLLLVLKYLFFVINKLAKLTLSDKRSLSITFLCSVHSKEMPLKLVFSQTFL